MKLTESQISKIKQKIILLNNKIIVRVDVSEEKYLSPDESSSNIYCINKDNEIIWRVEEKKTKRPFEYDMFVYLAQNSSGEIIADRFSGFEYKINPETGEAYQVGFHK